jgi:hypothetical protein
MAVIDFMKKSAPKVYGMPAPLRPLVRRSGGELRRHPRFFDSRIDVGVQYTPLDATAEDLRCLADPKARVHFLIGDTDLV